MVQYDVKRITQGSENSMISFDFAKTPITQVADYIIIAAQKNKTSDIHFDPRDEGMMVRFRIDGDCQDYTFIPKAYERNLTTRLKLLANMNITETRLPQDGAIKGQFGDTYMDMRVACLPTNQGEKIVIRILDYTRSLQGIDSLGFHPKNLEKIHHMMGVPNGIILVTGATGSGKSTTTYSMLSALNKPEINVITVEDPVEMNIEGINQVQVNSEIGMTFAAALRSILREDPNVILIGEIRDSETAQIAVRASITGHLVMSTLHTNNALATVERLLDMDVERYLLSTALTGIISQRLAKQLCPHCRTQRKPTKYEQKIYKKFLHQDVDLVWDANPKGCDNCRKGYRGRIAVHEVLLLDDRIRNALNDEKMTKEDFAKMIYGGNTISMLQDALIKSLEGQTSFDEVYKTIEIENEDEDNYTEQTNEIITGKQQEEPASQASQEQYLVQDNPFIPNTSTERFEYSNQELEIPHFSTPTEPEQNNNEQSEYNNQELEIPHFTTPEPEQQQQEEVQTNKYIIETGEDNTTDEELPKQEEENIEQQNENYFEAPSFDTNFVPHERRIEDDDEEGEETTTNFFEAPSYDTNFIPHEDQEEDLENNIAQQTIEEPSITEEDNTATANEEENISQSEEEQNINETEETQEAPTETPVETNEIETESTPSENIPQQTTYDSAAPSYGINTTPLVAQSIDVSTNNMPQQTIDYSAAPSYGINTTPLEVQTADNSNGNLVPQSESFLVTPSYEINTTPLEIQSVDVSYNIVGGEFADSTSYINTSEEQEENNTEVEPSETEEETEQQPPENNLGYKVVMPDAEPQQEFQPSEPETEETQSEEAEEHKQEEAEQQPDTAEETIETKSEDESPSSLDQLVDEVTDEDDDEDEEPEEQNKNKYTISARNDDKEKRTDNTQEDESYIAPIVDDDEDEDEENYEEAENAKKYRKSNTIYYQEDPIDFTIDIKKDSENDDSSIEEEENSENNTTEIESTEQPTESDEQTEEISEEQVAEDAAIQTEEEIYSKENQEETTEQNETSEEINTNIEIDRINPEEGTAPNIQALSAVADVTNTTPEEHHEDTGSNLLTDPGIRIADDGSINQSSDINENPILPNYEE